MRHAVRRTASKGVMSKRDTARSSDREVMRHLSRSQIFKDYERAFSEAMGLPLNIRAHDSWSRQHHGRGSRCTRSILARFQGSRRMFRPKPTHPRNETTSARYWLRTLQSAGRLRRYHILGLTSGEVMLRTRPEHFAPYPAARLWGTIRIGNSSRGLIFGRAFFAGPVSRDVAAPE